MSHFCKGFGASNLHERCCDVFSPRRTSAPSALATHHFSHCSSCQKSTQTIFDHFCVNVFLDTRPRQSTACWQQIQSTVKHLSLIMKKAPGSTPGGALLHFKLKKHHSSTATKSHHWTTIKHTTISPKEEQKLQPKHHLTWAARACYVVLRSR